MLHRSKKGPLWTEHGTGSTAPSAESWCSSNGTLPKTRGEEHRETARVPSPLEERETKQKPQTPKAMIKWVKWHKIIHPPATPKSYKGNSLAFRQWHYYVGNHKVHIAFQNKAWLDLGRLEHKLSLTVLCRLEQIQTPSVHSDPSMMKQTVWVYVNKHVRTRTPSPSDTKKNGQQIFAGEKKETLEVLPQAAQSQNLQALIARMACVRPCEWLVVDLLPVLIQSFRKRCFTI